MDDGLEDLLATEQIEPNDSLIGWAHAFADAVLSDNEVPVDLLELLASGGGGHRSSPNTQPGIPHPAVAAGLTGIPRDADDPGSRPLAREEGSGLRVIASQNIATRNEGSGLRVLPSPPTREGSGLRPLPPIPSHEGSGLRALPTREGSGLHALPNPQADDDADGDDVEMLDDDELEMLDDELDEPGESSGGERDGESEREVEPEWRRALDDAQSGVIPLPVGPPVEEQPQSGVFALPQPPAEREESDDEPE